MLRKLAVFIISAGLTMSPLSVQALGFGGIKLKSSLNEKLNAEVALLSATENDIQSLTIRLASDDAFLRAGIDRTALLNKLKFQVKQNDSGDYYISVTTTETVREPFMNFLMELNWKNGRMLREYTMLIDPPGSAPKQFAEPAPVVAETVATEAEPVAEIAAQEETPFIEPIAEPTAQVMPELIPEIMPEPVAEVTEQAPVLVEPAMDAAQEDITVAVDETTEQALVIATEPEAIAEPEVLLESIDPIEMPPVVDVGLDSAITEEVEAEIDEDEAFAGDELWPRIPLTAYSETGEQVEETATAGELGDLDYGITKANDNLWNIAEKLRQGDESVSVYQVMMALLQNNPDAFIDNNVHRLKVGHVLRIDDPSALTSLSRQQAANQFIEQTNTWNSYREQVAETTSVQPIMAGTDTAAMSDSSSVDSGELTLSSPDGESLTAGGGANEETLNNDLATIQDQLRQARSDSGTMRTRNVALNEKLQSLESELNRLQRSLSVKDDELAALQQQLSSLNEQTADQPAPVVVPEPAAEIKPAVEPEAPVAEMAEEKPVATETTVTESAADEVKQAEVAVTPEPAKADKSPVQLAEEIAAQETAANEPSIMDTVMGVIASVTAAVAGVFASLNLGGDSLLYIAAPIAIILLLLVILVIKRRRQGDNFQESILTGAATAAAGESAGPASGDSTTFSEESSFLSDFAMSGASAIEADDSEVDPLTEADVFMAYGRYEAAEERLNEAIQNEPDRLELHAKLLELHHTTQNRAAFESGAEDFYARLGGAEAGNPLWEKIVVMGIAIAPENPLFSEGASAAAGVPATSEVPAIDDPGMDMTDSQVMDIGLETGVFAASDFSAGSEAPADPSSDDMDFNLDLGESAESADMDFNLDIGGTEEPATTAEPVADLDFNLDMDTDSPAVPESAASTDDGGLDFNLDMDAGETTANAEPAADLDFNLDMASGEEDKGGLDFDLDMGSDNTSADDGGLDFDTGSDDGSLDLNLDASDTADADIGGGDEVGTKLDLAKAYIDMGDPEGARSILDEVMDEGSSTQKEEAQSLLGQIA